MQESKSSPEENTSHPQPSEQHISTTLNSLCDRIQQTRDELFDVSRSSIPAPTAHNSLHATLELAKCARTNCKTLRSHLTSLSAYYKTIQQTHAEILARQHLLRTLRSTLEHLHSIHLLSKTIDSAQESADHAEISRACIQFESLTTSHSLFNPDYKCLQPISDRVALSVAQSMRLLRASLRAACRKFDPAAYEKCMLGFHQLGAAKQFAQHVLQVFEEEGRAVFDDAVALDARASQKLMSFFSMVSGLMAQFLCVIRFHVGKNEERGADETRRDVGKEFWGRSLPFDQFGNLAIKMLHDERVALLAEQTTIVLHVFEAAQRFHGDISAGNLSAGESLEELVGKDNARRGSVVGVIELRRMGSKSKLGIGEGMVQKKKSGRWSTGAETEPQVAKAIKGIAQDCLSACHVRHAEELEMITESPESWIRIRMSETDVQSIFWGLFSGVDGRLGDLPKESSTTDEGKEKMKPRVEEIGLGSATFTTASLAMLRWVSEYATIGVTVPDVFSDALSNITDIFLILVHASIDMKSRSQTSQSEPFLKVFEDLLLERPKDKTIGDFLPMGLNRSFNIFLSRYGSEERRRIEDADIGQSKERWGRFVPTTLALYSNAAGQLFANGSMCTLSIVRQCVAAEGIGTFCEVLERFTSYLEEKVRHNGKLGESSRPLKMASLKAAIALGRAVQRAFYQLLAWDIIGGWQAVSAVAETCRSFYDWGDSNREVTASMPSPFVGEMLSRIKTAYSVHTLPPAAAERINVVVCETAMDIVLEGFSRVQHCSSTAATSQMLLDVRTLDLALVKYTGLHPCPGHTRTNMYIKATLLNEQELLKWAQRHRRKLNLSEAHIKALILGSRIEEVPIVDQIITP